MTSEHPAAEKRSSLNQRRTSAAAGGGAVDRLRSMITATLNWTLITSPEVECRP